MKMTIKSLVFALVAVFSLTLPTSCIKDKFDAPPADGEDPNLTVTSTIADLKARFAGVPVSIDDETIIAGIVSGDDKTGNFYKSITIQDASGGILIRLERSDLYVDYPVGRRVFVKCKGLFLGDYNNLIQLGGGDDGAGGVTTIADPLISKYLVKGKYDQPLVPIVVKIADLNNSLQSMLIKIENVEFTNTDKGKTWADAVGQSSLSRYLQDCDGNKAIVRTSGFASFASELTPLLNGSFIGVYSIFNADKQLILRDPSDVDMQNTRCDGGTGVVTPITIAAVRALYSGTDVAAPADKAIKGIVISDRVGNNTSQFDLVVQDATGGITIGTGVHTFNVGDEVEINISGATITRYKGTLKLDDLDASVVTKTGTGTVTPRNATIAETVANYAAWESQLVKISGVTLSGNSGKFYNGSSGNVTMNDGTGTLTMYTNSYATFADQSYPTGTRSVTGIVFLYNSTKEFTPRNPADIQ